MSAGAGRVPDTGAVKVVGAKRRGKARAALIGLGALVLETAVMRRRGYTRPGNVVVRCRQGHLFTTIWIPAVSVKALRLGPWRVQRCPVGHHFSVVSLVDRSSLSEEDRRLAAASHDLRLP